MKILIVHILKLTSIIVITITCFTIGNLFSNLHSKKISKDYNHYYVTSIVVSVVQEGFSDGVYYYKVEYMFTRNNETHIISELVKEKTTYLPYRIGDEVEFYILEDNKTIKEDFFTFYSVPLTVFMLLGVLCTFCGGIAIIFGLFQIIIFIKYKIFNEEIRDDFFKLS